MEFDIENHTSTMENPPSPFKIASSPSTPQPLQPVSTERQNHQRLPQSPSLALRADSNGSPRKAHQHRLSDAADVRARIAYLNSMTQNNSPTRSTSPTKLSMLNTNNAAIQRAMLGREEAETALATFMTQIETMKARERLVSERVEALQEQLEEARGRQRHERTVYEREIKQSKKTEYKAELAVIKLQEDLREARSELEGYKVRSEHDKAEKEKARQEAFERAYAVAGMTEELQEMKRKLEVVEQERDAAAGIAGQLQETKRKLEIVEQERDAAIAMAVSKVPERVEVPVKTTKDEPESGAKRKKPTSEFNGLNFDEFDLDAPDCPMDVKYAALKMSNDFLRRQVKEDQEAIHFMNMQCQFKTCPCRMAERDGVRFVHDYEYDAKVREQNAKRRKLEGLEPELPLPVFRSLLQKRALAKGKQLVKGDAESHKVGLAKAEIQVSQGRQTNQQPAKSISTEPVAAVDEPVAPLPPSQILIEKQNKKEQISELEEAAKVPLPSSQPAEIDPTDDTPEPTAQLEDLTQVIVEPSTSANDFLFKASITSNKAVPASVSVLRQSKMVRMSDDLFDISPPKKQMPPRPSTAMGVLSVDSPMRLVPGSPRTLKQRSMTPKVDMPQRMTTRVALNDTSPARRSRHQRHQSQANKREQSRGRSPAPARTTGLDRSSPAPSTLFPITPVIKHERMHRHHVATQARPQTTLGHYPDSSTSRKEVIMTTTVPLRDDPEEQCLRSIDTRDEIAATGSSSAPPSATGTGSTPFSVPGTPNMTREQALAQIRARRDRARSINMRKSAEEGSKTPGSTARRGVNLKERLGDAKVRDFSQASAPGRI